MPSRFWKASGNALLPSRNTFTVSAGASTTTLNPADIANATLSGGNLTGTITGASGVAGGSRAIATITSGKHYWEATTANNITHNLRMGLTDGSTSLSNNTWMENYAAARAIVFHPASDAIYFNTALLTATSFGFVYTGTWMFAYDQGAQLFWVGLNGSWMNTSNPATGTGGSNVAGVSASQMPFFQASTNGTTPDSVSFNFGGSAYTYTPPSGFGNI